MPNQQNYTIAAAALRVGRSTRTIERWIRHGMNCRTVSGRIVIDHAVLIARYQQSLENGRHAQPG